MITMESLSKLQEQYEKKLSELEMNYQDTGSASTQKTIYKYKELIEVMRLAELQLTGGCHACERHDRNVNYMIGKYENYQKENLKDFENFNQFISDLKDLR